MRKLRDDRGFTVIELLVTIGVFSIASVGFYTVLFSGVRGSDTTQDIGRISQEARTGLNRMVRDTREAETLRCPHSSDSSCPDGATSYKVEVDFDGDGVRPTPDSSPNPQGDFEVLTYAYNSTLDAITLNGEVLIEGVEPIPGVDMFRYSSNLLEHDQNDDGVTEIWELDQAAQNGATLDANRYVYVSDVRLAFRIRSGSRVTEFTSEAQLRNRR